MSTKKIKPAFPGRASAMGYEPGLTKLEWLTTQLLSGASYNHDIDADEVADAVAVAKLIVAACEKAEAND